VEKEQPPGHLPMNWRAADRCRGGESKASPLSFASSANHGAAVACWRSGACGRPSCRLLPVRQQLAVPTKGLVPESTFL